MFRRKGYQRLYPDLDDIDLESYHTLKIETKDDYFNDNHYDSYFDKSLAQETKVTKITKEFNDINDDKPLIDLEPIDKIEISDNNPEINDVSSLERSRQLKEESEIRIKSFNFDQITKLIDPDKTVQDPIKTDYEIVLFPYSHKSIPLFTSLHIKCSNNNVSVYKDKIKTSKPVLVDVIGGCLRLWDAYYSDIRNIILDGSTVLVGYHVRDFEDNKILVKNKIVMTEFPINFLKIDHIEFQGDESNITFDDDLFNGKNVKFKSRGFSKVNLGRSDYEDLKML